MSQASPADQVQICHDSRVLFVGRTERGADSLSVEGYGGQVVVEGSAPELESAASLLVALDGWNGFSVALSGSGVDPDQGWALTRGLIAAHAAVDLSQSWRDSYRLSCNPPSHGRLMLFEEAYELERWRPGGEVRRAFPPEDQGYLSSLGRRRRSAPLGELKSDGEAALEAAMRLASDAYRLHRASRPIAGGGALYPLHFWVGGEGGDAAYSFYALDHDSDEIVDWATVSSSCLQDAFVPDPEVAHAIEVGAALVVVAADPRRTVLKYSDRAWRYILMEVGAVAHHMTLQGVEIEAPIRPIGGFLDGHLEQLLDAPVIPLLTLFVGSAGKIS